jgi:hypothetical protein
MTFCESYIQCQNGLKCERALTPKVKNMAKIWSLTLGVKDEVPIAKYIGEPTCFEQYK